MPSKRGDVNVNAGWAGCTKAERTSEYSTAGNCGVGVG